MAEMEEPKSTNHWIHIPTQLAVGSFCAYWWYWHRPVPNKAVLWLAGVAVIMALWEMRPIHKAGYLLLVVWLMFIENRAIDKDRADFAKDEASRRQEERQEFSNIGTTITANVQKLLEHSDLEFSKTMERSNQILAGLSETIKTETGGDSFCWVYFEKQLGHKTSGLHLMHQGDYPLTSVTVSIFNKQRIDRQGKENPLAGIRSTEMTFGPYDLPVHGTKKLIDYNEMTGDNQDFSVNISAKNGYWSEEAHLKFIPGPYDHKTGMWVQAVKVSKAIPPRHGKAASKAEIFRCVEKQFPRNELHWPKPPHPESTFCTLGY